MSILEFHHKGHIIRVWGDGMFHVLDDEAEVGAYASLAEAKKSIENNKPLVKRKVSLPALTRQGGPITITGINRANSRIIPAQNFTSFVYADTPKMRSLMAEREILNERVRKLTARIDKGAISTQCGYGNMRPDLYEGALQDLERAHKEAMEADLS